MKLFYQYLFITLNIASTLPTYGQATEPYEMNIEGVKVIVQPSGNDIVVVKTIIKGGVQNYPANKQGIEALAFTALTECGTLQDNKNSFKDKLDKLSAKLRGTTAMDYASVTMNCILADFDKVWPLYTAALTQPKFDAKEFERIKQDAINNIRAQESDPEVSIQMMAAKNAFKGKDYAKEPSGTVATVTPLTASQVKAYYTSILTKARMIIVVVGQIDKAQLEKNITALLSKIPKGVNFVAKKDSYKANANSFVAEKRDNATNYIVGMASGPQPGTPEYNAYSIASRIFANRHFLEVRTNVINLRFKQVYNTCSIFVLVGAFV
jgi:zinc protease